MRKVAVAAAFIGFAVASVLLPAVATAASMTEYSLVEYTLVAGSDATAIEYGTDASMTEDDRDPDGVDPRWP